VAKDPTEYQSGLCCVFRNDFTKLQTQAFLLTLKFEVWCFRTCPWLVC